MSVATALVVGLVANPGIDEALVDALGSAIGNEAVPKNMPATDVFPFGMGKDHR